MTASIVDLEEAVASLPATARAVAGRILAISTTIGRLEPPPEMHEWIRKFFGSVEAVRRRISTMRAVILVVGVPGRSR